ncbi:hypothetical protein ACWEPC_57425 [Nonomuraea sp. NPDC004297]
MLVIAPDAVISQKPDVGACDSRERAVGDALIVVGSPYRPR